MRRTSALLFLIISFWYSIPLLFLFITKNIFLPNATLVLFSFLIGYLISLLASGKLIVTYSRPIYYSQKLVKLISYLTLGLQVYCIFKLFYSDFNILQHRNLVWEDPYYLFNSSILFTLYLIFLIPTVIILSIYILSKEYRSFDDLRVLKLLYLIIFIDSVIMLGRFQLMFLLFLLFLQYRKFSGGYFKLIIFTFLFLIISQFVIFFRQFFADSSLDSNISFITYDYIEKSAIAYQYYGYLMFENLTRGNNVFGNIFSFNTLNFPIYILNLVGSKFGVTVTNNWEKINLLLSNGIYLKDFDLQVNAFSTNFLPIYLDFGYLGVFLFGSITGFILSANSKSTLWKFEKYLMFFLVIFGIYQPLILYLYGFVLFLNLLFLLPGSKYIINKNTR